MRWFWYFSIFYIFWLVGGFIILHQDRIVFYIFVRLTCCQVTYSRRNICFKLAPSFTQHLHIIRKSCYGIVSQMVISGKLSNVDHTTTYFFLQSRLPFWKSDLFALLLIDVSTSFPYCQEWVFSLLLSSCLSIL